VSTVVRGLRATMRCDGAAKLTVRAIRIGAYHGHIDTFVLIVFVGKSLGSKGYEIKPCSSMTT
jgi:hypothetical protein